MPGLRQNSTLLRLVRLLRVIRIVRVLPDLRVLLFGVWRSIPPLASIGAVTGRRIVGLGLLGQLHPGRRVHVLNVLIGVVVNSMEVARELDRR